MFEPILSRSIQRWEYEGGRIPATENGNRTGHNRKVRPEARTSTSRVEPPASLEPDLKRHSTKAERSVGPRRSSAAVSSAKNGTGFAATQLVRAGTVLVPMDFTAGSYAALDYAVGAALTCNWSIGLVHVVQKSYAEGFVDRGQREQIRSEAERAAHMKLNALAHSKRSAGVPVTVLVRHGLPEYEIARVADCLNVKMIIVGRNPRNFLVRLIFGSVTQDVIDIANCPVLVINARSGNSDEQQAQIHHRRSLVRNGNVFPTAGSDSEASPRGCAEQGLN